MLTDKLAELTAKIEFWYAKKFIKIDKHYTFFVDLNGDPGTFAIKFLKKYPGVIVEYGEVKIGKDNLLNFSYDVIANPNNQNVKSKGFARFTSNVMRNIILNSISLKEQNENRNFDSFELDSERSVYEEELAVPEKRVSKRKPRKKTV